MNIPTFRLDGRKAIVTGAATGIGRAAAEGLAHYGADVAITELPSKLDAAKAVADEIAEKYGRRVIALPLEMPNIASIQKMVGDAASAFGRVDILINNAGVQIPKYALEVTEEDWDRVLDVNLKGTFFVAQAVAKEMLKNKYGRIVSIASQNGMVGYYKRAAYCSAKAGVVNLTRVLAIEWAQYGINVNAIGPTFIRTPLTEVTFKDEKIMADLMQRIPLGRVGEIEEVIGAIVYLASDAASLVTGHTLMVDGGWTAM